MVVLLPVHRVAQIFPARVGSSAKDVHGRFRELSLDGDHRVDSGRPVLLLWIRDLGRLSLDGKLDISSDPAEFRRRLNGSLARTNLQVALWSACTSLLH